MNKNNASLTAPKALYCAVWLIVALVALLSEMDILPTGYIASSKEIDYALQMISIVTTLLCTWMGLRLFAVKAIQEELKAHPQSAAKFNMVRTTIVALPIIINLVIYYGALHSTTPLFGLLIALTAFVFCYPKHDEITVSETESTDQSATSDK